jgi:hypothetical protein
VVLAADCILAEFDRTESRPGWGRESVFLAEDGRQQSCTAAMPYALIFFNFCAGIRAHFGAQIPGTKSSPDSGLPVLKQTKSKTMGLIP